MLRVTPTSPTHAPARLREFVWQGPDWDRAQHQRADGAVWLVRSRVDGDRRELRHWRIDRGRWIALDETVFRLAPDFAETERRHARGQPNQHATPIVLPAVLDVDRTVSPLPGVVATLTWHGFVLLELGSRHEHRAAIALTVRVAEVERTQWLVRGIGEVALGSGEGAWERWLVAWSGGADHLFGGLPELDPDALPDLPEAAPPRPAGIF